jgi:hypothetical protein
MRPIHTLLAVTVVGVAAIALTIWLFRWETALKPDGSSVSRDRLTGDILVCSPTNACQLRSSTKLIPTLDWKTSSFKDFLDEVERGIYEERQTAADASRSTKGGPRKLLDVGISLGAGVGELGIDTFDWLFGPPTYKPGEQWTRIWKTRNEVWESIDIFKRESMLNRVASYVGYYLSLILSAAWIAFLLREPIQRRLQKLSGRLTFRKSVEAPRP